MLTSKEQGDLRNGAEALVKAAAWLRRRAELIAANIRDGRHQTVGTDCLAGAVELKRIERELEEIALKTGITSVQWAETVR